MSAYASPDLERVRAVTANFFFWQGLRWIPMGFVLILFALGPFAQQRLGIPRTEEVTLVLMLVATWLSTTVLGRYYARRYGRVQGIPGQHARRTSIKWLVVYPAMFAALILDWKLNAPMFISGAVFAAGIEAYRRSTGGGRRHYIAGAILLALMTFAPLAGIGSSRELLFPLLGVLGGIYVIGGALDHRELVKILGPAPTEDDGRAV